MRPFRLAACLFLGALGCSGGNPTAPPPPQLAGGTAGTGTPSGGTGGSAMGGSGGTGGTGVCGMPLAGAPPICDGVQAGPAPIRLLTHVQYDNTVADLLGDTSRPSSRFPAENEVLGYRNNVAANQVSPRLIEAYQVAAEELAARAVADRLAELAPCAGGDEAVCGRSFIRDFGGRAFRRSLDDAEARIYDALLDATLAQGYAKAIELVIEALLQSPQFLYRLDALPAPTPETGAIALGSQVMASRLAYFLTNSAPDAELLAKAAANALQTDAELEGETRRLLETPRARAVALDFADQWLGLARLDGAAREAADVPYAPDELSPDFKASLNAFLDRVFWQTGSDVETLFTSPTLFLTEKLAPLYGVAPTAGALTELDAPEQRRGLLTQPALMALFAHADQSAPVLRGAFVRERILCLSVPDPPPDVNNTPPAIDPNATTRERFAQHTADSRCAGCHLLIDGIGFGFERYDQFGRYRATENGLDVDESGEVIESCESGLEGTFAGAAELASRLSTSTLARDCLATQWYRYAMGRIEDQNDSCTLDGIKARFAAADGNLRELLVAIVLSEAFRYRPATEVSP